MHMINHRDTETILDIDQYKHEIRLINKQLPKPWVKEFLQTHYPDIIDNQSIRMTLINFMNGNAYRHAYLPPYAFMDKIKAFHKLKINLKSDKNHE